MQASRNPAKSRPLSANVKRLMRLARASPQNSNVIKVQRQFSQRDLAYCHKQGNLFMEAAYLFDLSAKETYLPQSRDPETGKLKRPKAILPQEWLKTFGMSVDEHTASTQIDLSDGFVSSGIPHSQRLAFAFRFCG